MQEVNEGRQVPAALRIEGFLLGGREAEEPLSLLFQPVNMQAYLVLLGVEEAALVPGCTGVVGSFSILLGWFAPDVEQLQRLRDNLYVGVEGDLLQQPGR